MYEIITHAFEPVYNKKSRVLILGTMPSPASREHGFYYSHPRNRFWPVMSDVFGADEPHTPEEKTTFALEHNFALWDVLRSCRIEGASDSSIRDPEPNDIPALLKETNINAVITTGGTATALYKRFFGELVVRRIALPSTSPANCRVSMAELCRAYAVVARITQEG